jgi:hypothetical protein
MNARKMMARMTTTTQKKNTMIPGMAYPAAVLALATAASYPTPLYLSCSAVISRAPVQRGMHQLGFPHSNGLPAGEHATPGI